MTRDFTYIDDIIDSIYKITKKIPKQTKGNAPARILNIGSNNPINIKKYIKIIETLLQKKAKKINYPMQKGDVKYTHADLKKLSKVITLKKNRTSIQTGIKNFINWHNEYYGK